MCESLVRTGQGTAEEHLLGLGLSALAAAVIRAVKHTQPAARAASSPSLPIFPGGKSSPDLASPTPSSPTTSPPTVPQAHSASTTLATLFSQRAHGGPAHGFGPCTASAWNPLRWHLQSLPPRLIRVSIPAAAYQPGLLGPPLQLFHSLIPINMFS